MPTREDYITQIEADLESDSGESREVLEERLEKVKATRSDEGAKKTYFDHLKESQS